MWVIYSDMPTILNNSKASRFSRSSISNALLGSLHGSSFSSTTGIPGGARKPAHFSIALNSSGSSALSSGLERVDSSSSQSLSSTRRSSELRTRPIGNMGSQTTPDTVSVNNASINNVSNASSSDVSFSNGPRSEGDNLSASPSRTSSIYKNFSFSKASSRAPRKMMALHTPVITEEDEEQKLQPNIASMAPNTRVQHKINANKGNLLLPTPSSSNSSLHPSPVVLGLMEKAASDSEGLLRLATDGTVSSGNLEGLVSRVITDIEDPSGNDHFRTTFLTIYHLFATNERLLYILKRRFESSELDPVAARSRYPYVNNAPPSNEY